MSVDGLTRLCLLTLIVAVRVEAQDEPVEQWRVPVLGTTANSVLDSEGNLLIGAGFLTKISPGGAILWERVLAHPAVLRWVTVDSQDNPIVGGKMEGPSGGFLTVKYDPEGNILWQAVDAVGTGPQGIRVAVDELGDVYIFGEHWGGTTGTGPTGHDFLTMKYDSAGNFQWARSAHGTGSDEPRSLAVRGGHVVVTGSAGPSFMTICYDYAGNEVWSDIYTDGISGAFDVVIGANGQVVICGLGTTDGDFPLVGTVVQYDSAGNEDWRVYHNGTDGPVDSFRRLAIDDAGFVAAVGWSSGSEAYEDWSVVKIDPAGQVLWDRNHGEISTNYEWATAVAMGPGGEVYAGGNAGTSDCTVIGTDGVVIKYAADGSTEWLHRLECGDHPHSLHLDPSGALMVGTGLQAYRIREQRPRFRIRQAEAPTGPLLEHGE